MTAYTIKWVPMAATTKSISHIALFGRPGNLSLRGSLQVIAPPPISGNVGRCIRMPAPNIDSTTVTDTGRLVSVSPS